MDSTLLKGLAILERVVAADAPTGVSDLARALGLPKSNVHRTLTSLRQAGYVLFDADSRRYYPSLKISQMGQRITARFSFRNAVAPALEALVATTGESAHFVLLDGTHVAFLANAVPAATVASVIPDNLTLRWDDTAFGVALVAALPEAMAEALLKAPGVSPDAAARLAEARAKDYATSPRHAERRIFEVAAPVRSRWDTVIGAIGLTGPALRFSETALPAQIAAVRAAAAQTFADSPAENDPE
jgi:DNA-binding IclR family transcriptional regulator